MRVSNIHVHVINIIKKSTLATWCPYDPRDLKNTKESTQSQEAIYQVKKNWCKWEREVTSEGPNKQTLKFPSAKSRNLLQPAQKCSDIEVMNETAPWCPSIRKFLAVSEGWSWCLFILGNRFAWHRRQWFTFSVPKI